MRILVVGGTLFIGRHLTEALLAGGHEVAILHRSPKSQLPTGVRGILADRNDGEAVSRVLAGERFDAVFDNVYDWERGTTGDQVAATARACLTDSLQRYVFMSSVGAFGEGLNHGDDDPLAPADFPETYARNKAMSERALFAITGLPAVTLRPPFVYGPGNPFNREAFFWDRLRNGLDIEVPEDGSRLMQFVYVKDIVWACLRILEKSEAAGHAFNLADPEALTQVEAIRAIAQASHSQPRLVFKPRGEAVFAEYFDLPPITMRIDRARKILGFQPTNFHAGLQETYDRWSQSK